MKNLILTIILLLGINLVGKASEDLKDSLKTSSIKVDSLVISLNIADLQKIESMIKQGESSWFTKYGTLVISILALLGAIFTSMQTNRRSRINTENQLNANIQNIHAQIVANKNQEIEKKRLELEYVYRTELKENFAKFVNKAVFLNESLNHIIDLEFNQERRSNDATEAYLMTESIRNELKNLYYSIKITLNETPKQKELEQNLDKYMHSVIFNIGPYKLVKNDYEQTLAKVYHGIKAVIHDDYLIK